MADDGQQGPSSNLRSRFAIEVRLALEEASGDPTVCVTACADCGATVVKVVGEQRPTLCAGCYARREHQLHSAAARGFHLGL